MEWIVSVCCEKLWHDFVVRTFTLITPVWRVLHQVSCSSETVTNAPKRKEMQKNMSLGSNGMDRERRYEKFRHDFVARTFALIAPVWRILRQVSCSSKTVPTAPNRKETHQTMSLVSNCVDQEHSLWKILTRHRGTNFCINCTSVARFLAIAIWSQMHPNEKERTKTWVWGPMVWIGSVVTKNSDTTSWHELLR